MHFAVHAGDIIETRQNVEDEWVDLLEQSQFSFMNVPHILVPGNHDLQNFMAHAITPASPAATDFDHGSYYSFDYNNAHFIVANTNDNENGAQISRKQVEWLKNDLATAHSKDYNWIIVAYHEPMFDNALFNEDDLPVIAEIRQLFDRYDVDLVLNGHTHELSVTHMLTYDEDGFASAQISDYSPEFVEREGVLYYQDPEGVLYITPNASGPKLHDRFTYRLNAAKEEGPLAYVAEKAKWDHLKSFFKIIEQPNEAAEYQYQLRTNRDGSTQNFVIYTIDGGDLTVRIYQVDGDLHQGKERSVELVYEFGIHKTMETDVLVVVTDDVVTVAQTQIVDPTETIKTTAATESSSDSVKRADSGKQTAAATLPRTGQDVSYLAGLTVVILGFGLIRRKSYK